MRRRSQAGFALLFVVIFLALLGLFLAVLGNTSKNFAGESVEQLLRSNCRQLLASGVAWAGQNRDKIVDAGQGGTFELEVSAFGVRQAACSVSVTKVDDKKVEVEVSASCAKGRLKARRRINAVIPTGHQNR